ncbi:MAG: hypothetical protein KDI46_07910 [Alphaproteobacteria bacterium]|nr:hypothetical protein [Alphaproteobacteria bacterium]
MSDISELYDEGFVENYTDQVLVSGERDQNKVFSIGRKIVHKREVGDEQFWGEYLTDSLFNDPFFQEAQNDPDGALELKEAS